MDDIKERYHDVKLVFLAAILAFFVAFNTLAQDEIHVGAGQIRCDTVAEILLQHGYLPLFRQHSSTDVRDNESWQTVKDTLGPLAKAYGCEPVVIERRIAPANVELQEPDVTNADAHISFPPPVYVVRHRVAIRGTANVANLRLFFIEFRLLDLDSAAEQVDEDYHTWLPATLPRIEPVQDGILGHWYTTSLPDGLYELRLTINTGPDPMQYVYLSPIRVEKAPSFAAARLEYPASDERALPPSVYDSSDPLVLTSDEYGLSTVIGPMAVPKGIHLVRWKNPSGTDKGRILMQVYALSPCFAFHETGADEDIFFGYDSSTGKGTEVLKIIEDGCQILLEVNETWGLEAWEIEIHSI